MHKQTEEITGIILAAAKRAREETAGAPVEKLKPVEWPIQCTIGPGLEGAIACESKIGYVNGSKGWLIYRGYDIFDLCAYSTYEEVAYLLLHGKLPTAEELETFKTKLNTHRYLNKTMRLIMSFPVEEMNTMAALRMGTNLMRREFTYLDTEAGKPAPVNAISADEDSIPMETKPMGERHAIYEFKEDKRNQHRPRLVKTKLEQATGLDACYHLISGTATLAAAIARIRDGYMPLDPDPELSHAANLLYMMTGRRPSPKEERIMDVALILHADHGMNASTFASMVVGSTLSDFYFSVGAGIAALSGPLHGGANEQVIYTIKEIGSSDNVKDWVKKAIAEKRRIPGIGHRVYKAYDPRARVLGPLARHLADCNRGVKPLLDIALTLEKEVIDTIGKEKLIFPNVDFYSGIVYSCLGIQPDMFTPIFAVSRVAGWTARVLEYSQHNRIFRPRAMYVGELDKQYIPVAERK
jgi:citrate synthase